MDYKVSDKTSAFETISPLDQAIDRYEAKAKQYYKALNETKNTPKDVREVRQQKLKEAQVHLEHERRLLESITDVQAELELYRERGREATRGARSEVARKQSALAAEKHHPTDILEKYMRAVPIPKPSSNHTAHHIVPGKGKTKDAYRARVRIHMYGIRINDPDNGVWLPKHAKHTPHWSMPKSLGHLEYHTHGYESWVLKRLKTKSSETFLRLELNMIGQMLQENNIPDEARKK